MTLVVDGIAAGQLGFPGGGSAVQGPESGHI